ncbi:MAG: hypothetical protein ABIT01_02615 [Thermoanaerobaculia bacterium]
MELSNTITPALDGAAAPSGALPAEHAPWRTPEPPLQRLAARVTGSWVFWLVFTSLAFGLPLVRSVLRPLPEAPPVLGTMPSYALVDARGQAFESSAMLGRILIAEFVSPSALALAPSPLDQLQRRVRNTGDAVHLVTFLRGAGAPQAAASSAQAHAGVWRWTLAGGETNELEASLRRALEPRLGPSISLDGKLLLIDAHGQVRRFVGSSKDEIDLMMRDIGLLMNLEGKK